MALAKAEVSAFFTGRKSKWLAIFRRLMARIVTLPGIDITTTKAGVCLSLPGDTGPEVGIVRITIKGLMVGLCLNKTGLRSPRLKSAKKAPKGITHEVLISSASEIDDEFVSWVRLAKHQARIAKRESV